MRVQIFLLILSLVVESSAIRLRRNFMLKTLKKLLNEDRVRRQRGGTLSPLSVKREDEVVRPQGQSYSAVSEDTFQKRYERLSEERKRLVEPLIRAYNATAEFFKLPRLFPSVKEDTFKKRYERFSEDRKKLWNPLICAYNATVSFLQRPWKIHSISEDALKKRYEKLSEDRKKLVDPLIRAYNAAAEFMKHPWHFLKQLEQAPPTTSRPWRRRTKVRRFEDYVLLGAPYKSQRPLSKP